MKAKVLFAVVALTLNSAVAFGKEAIANMTVPKMDCGSCAVVVKRVLTKTVGVKSLKIDTDKRLVTVVYEDSVVGKAQLLQAIAKAGFDVKPVVNGE